MCLRDHICYNVIVTYVTITINKSGKIYNLDGQDTGKLPKPSRSGNPNYDGPPIHTLTIFANPFIDDEPDIFDEGVLAIEPGEEVPTEGDWHTLYFMPGLHNVGLDFRIHSNRWFLFSLDEITMSLNRSYYIPGDAVVFGTINNGERAHNEDGSNIRWLRSQVSDDVT